GNRGRARVRVREAGEDRDQRGLARAVGSQQTEEFPGLDSQVDARECLYAAEAARDAADLDRGRHATGAGERPAPGASTSTTPYSSDSAARLPGISAKLSALPSAAARRFQASNTATPAESTRSTRASEITPDAGSGAPRLAARTCAALSIVSAPETAQRSPGARIAAVDSVRLLTWPARPCCSCRRAS